MAHRPKPQLSDFGTSRNDRGSYLAALRAWEKEHDTEINYNADKKWLTDQL